MSFVVARMSAAAGLPTTVLGMNTILLLPGVALLVWAGYAFNQLIRLRNQTRAAWADIDVQLTRRHDLVPQLVAAVQGYAGHERGVLTAATELRAQALAQRGPAQLGEVETGLEPATAASYGSPLAHVQILRACTAMPSRRFANRLLRRVSQRITAGRARASARPGAVTSSAQ